MSSSILALLPDSISALLLDNSIIQSPIPTSPSKKTPSTSTTTTTSLDPRILRSWLKQIPRSTWIRLGSECHNSGFAAEAAVAIKGAKPAAASSVSMFSTAATAARAAALLSDNGIPRILKTIERRRRQYQQYQQEQEQQKSARSISGEDKKVEEEEEEEGAATETRPALWDLYEFYKTHCSSTSPLSSALKENGKGKRRIPGGSENNRHHHQPQFSPWQLEFLKSGCPELVIQVFLDTFLEHGPRHGFERDLPIDLIEALDYEWRSSSPSPSSSSSLSTAATETSAATVVETAAIATVAAKASKRAVLALIQTLISCRRYAKNHNRDSKQAAAARGLVLGVLGRKKGSSAEPMTVITEAGSTTAATGVDINKFDEQQQELDQACHQLALLLAEACAALEVFFETERGRNLPKLLALYQQETAADAKMQSRSSGSAGSNVGGIGTSVSGGGSGSGLDRGIKRPLVGGGASGVGSGFNGSDPLDPVSRKRLKSTGGTETGGSLSVVSSTLSPTAASSPSSSLSTPTGVLGQQPSPASPLTTVASRDNSADGNNGGDKTNTKPFKTTSQFVDQAMTGYASVLASQTSSATGGAGTGVGVGAGTGAGGSFVPSTHLPSTSTLASSVSAHQQAKLSNPLWSPIMGLTHLPQLPTKYAAQADSELERWITLLGHMDGAVFSEKLVGLIKSVYPSDQKFLLDQILIDFMCWDGSGSSNSGSSSSGGIGGDRDRELGAEGLAFSAAKYLKEGLVSNNDAATMATATSTTSATGALTMKTKSNIKTGQWVMEMIMSALVGLVIKPEESSSYLEPGSKKWIEPIEFPADTFTASGTSGNNTVKNAGDGSAMASSNTAAGTVSILRPSAALGGTKKRRVRNLYNRRVSPFYAVLTMFQTKRVVGRISGMIYSSGDDLPDDLAGAGAGGIADSGAGGVAGLDAQELLKQVSETSSITNAAPKLMLNELEEPDPMVAKMDRRKKAKKLKKREKKVQLKLLKKMEMEGRVVHGEGNTILGGGGSSGGSGGASNFSIKDLDAEEEIDRRAKMDLDEQAADVEAQLAGFSGLRSDSSVLPKNGKQSDKTKDGDHEAKKEKDKDEDRAQSIGGVERDEDAPDSPPNHQPHDDEEDDTEALELARQVEASRIVCQAPLNVLMFILQYLTRANQSGALDSWITDALSATLPALQIQYFEWMLCCLAVALTSPWTSSSSTSVGEAAVAAGYDSGDVVVFEEELLRLLAVLLTAQGIGYDPVRTAMENVERAHRDLMRGGKGENAATNEQTKASPEDGLRRGERGEETQMEVDNDVTTIAENRPCSIQGPYWTRVKTLLANH
ncbi:hypothetical protein BX616_001571 [Lobosporangium transversale]|uniref:Uncharacterized protein n=1 Tax=Lobosporangium transversale TaxID=64571 RepID=A0A1Y2GVH8_9FUNG|nr:hypothetical protein BCR41DRAFT_420478 [Lobosporangium transversale]KAF9903643.1 hypothetical protein BX616_001571 [Lobosporangium transversale]ORZ22704.1 hypothetical protein BCR41DRAFT_420478 [Lobosporangium transversale]|eukprot:XP_021883258.1 hypothetical protein BCR41DRAFT_420478 [Lobosporangium transversale]